MNPDPKEVPVLFTTYNRLEYTKKALKALIDSNCGLITVFDNNSQDGTADWLSKLSSKKVHLVLNKTNLGVSGAMNYFFANTRDAHFVAKVDNDTIVPKDWIEKLMHSMNECKLDIVQAKHPIMRQSHISGDFDTWMKTLASDTKLKHVHYSSHVGGTAVLIRREIISEKLESKWVLGGWDKFQAAHPNLRIAFDSSVEVALLDTKGGSQIHDKYSAYYKDTQRSNLEQQDVIDRLTKEVIDLNELLSIQKERNQSLKTELEAVYRSRAYKLISSIRKIKSVF